MVMKEKEIMAIGMMISMAEMETHIVVGETMKTAMAAMVTEMMIPMEEAEVLIVTKIAQAGTPIYTMLLVMTVNHHVEAVEPKLMIIMLKEGTSKETSTVVSEIFSYSFFFVIYFDLCSFAIFLLPLLHLKQLPKI